MAFFTTNDGVKIHYEDAGSGKPIVMVHGWNQTAKAFCENVPGLSQKYRVITVDMRGHGESDKPSYGYHMERLSMDLHQLLEHLDLQDVTLLGWSMGCSVIWGYWDLFRADRISKFIFHGESPLNLIQDDYPNGFIDYAGLCGLADEIVKNHDTAIPSFARGMFCEDKNIEKYLKQFEDESLKSPGKEIALLVKHHCYTDWRDVIPTITLPTLIIAENGPRGCLVKLASNQWNHDHIAGSEMVTFDSGHVLFIEQPEKFNQVVADFVG